MKKMAGLGAAVLALAGCSGSGTGGNAGASGNLTNTAAPARATATAREAPPALALDRERLVATCIPGQRPRPIAQLSRAQRTELNRCLNAETVRQLGARLPIRIDSLTQIDRVSVEGAALVYRYRIDRRIAELPAGTPDRLNALTRHNACAGEDVRQTLALGGAQVYRWVDRDEAPIREVRIDAC